MKTSFPDAWRDVLTSAQMRAVEAAEIALGRASGLELMERAGREVVAAVFAEWPDLAAAPHRTRVLCGPGNNGGDGFVIARLLAGWGWQVDLRLFGDTCRLPPDARSNHDRWAAMGTVLPLNAPDDPEGCDLIVDALFGTGLTRSLPGGLVGLLPERVGAGGPRIVAVDMPSGLCADSGRVIGATSVRADLTVSFHRMKLGHLLAEGPAQCGRVVVADIGLTGGGGAAVRSIGAPAPAKIDKAAPLGGAQHKYGHGHALVLSGPMGRSGAARLAARGALRVGAGLVTVAAPGGAMLECAAQLTAIMLRRCDDATALGTLLADARLNVVCLGPGLGGGEGTRALVAAALAGKRGTVLDADALTAFAEAPEALFAQIHPTTVLTPHAGEFARLFPDIAARLAAPADAGPAYSKLDAIRAAAVRAGCTVLFKGADTVIADAEGRVALHAAAYDRAAPWLATAGSGDVLAGMIAGLMARGLPPFEAAGTAAWLHVEAARRFGPGLIAEDLPEALPAVLRGLLGGGAAL